MRNFKLFITSLSLPIFLFAATPQAPSNLQLRALSSNSVSISWQDNSNNETGFKIKRDDILIHITGSDVTSYVDSGLDALTTYKYTVIATDQDSSVVVVENVIDSGIDDVEEHSDGSIHSTSSDLELTTDSSVQTIGLRFTNLSIPKDVTITKAYIQFQADDVSSQTTNLTIHAQNTDYARNFNYDAHDISSRALTSAFVSWSPAPWTVVGERGSKQATTDLSSIVQEVINRGGWQDGNAMAFVITGSGKRVADSFEGNHAPTLHIEYTEQIVEEDKPLIISEVMAANIHTLLDPDFYQFSDWIELKNQTDSAINISNYKLSDKLNKGKWKIPAGTTIPAHGHLLFWADKKDTHLKGYHTDFSLKSKGEAVGLFDRDGNLVDGFEFPKQKGDISTRVKNHQLVYMKPTPAAENSITYNTQATAEKPTFSRNGGFYDNGVTLTLSTSHSTTIYYTLDGSLPTTSSAHYTNPIDIDHTTVVRARSVENGRLMSDEVTKTFFINEDSTLPVVSLSTDSRYLWDNTVGIYTIGTNGIKGCDVVANFNQKWKRPAHIEFYDKNKNLGFSQEVDIKISGQCSRKRKEKSIAIEADSKYGKKEINYKLFAEKNIDTFKSFKLRNGGQDWYEAMVRDAVAQRIVKDELDVDYQAYEPSIVFINGQYWGIHNIREKRNEDYLANNYPSLNPKKVDILYTQGDVKEGSADEYLELLEFIENHSLSSSSNYNYVASKMQIDNFIDYQIAQIYIANSDWPVNNIRYWKEQKDGTKWRWMMDDQDSSFNLASFDVTHNTLRMATSYDTDGWRNPPESTFLLRSLLQNDNFKSRFESKFRNYLNTAFAPNRVKSIIDGIANKIAAEMPRHIARWTGDGPNDMMIDSIDDWEYYIGKIKNFANDRPAIINNQLDDMF